MNVQLLPRLTSFGVETILEGAKSGSISSEFVNAILSDRPTLLSFAASGGNRSEATALEVGKRIRDIAATCGFPDNPSQVARSKFDQEVAIYLATTADLASGEALRDDVWAFLATAVVPDIVSWRFPDPAIHRFKGGVRNALQRLWARGTVLDRGPNAGGDRWKLVRSLSEDASVQIFERASIGGNRALALAIAENWVKMAGDLGRGAMEPIMRRATVLVRLRNEIVDLASLPTEALEAIVQECFHAVAEPAIAD